MRKFKKHISSVLCLLFVMALVGSNSHLAFAKAKSAPTTPAISHNNWSGENNFEITMNMWWGENGTSVKLYENGKLIDEKILTDNSPNEQKATFTISNRDKGTYKYKVELINEYGKSTSSEISVNVTKEFSGETQKPAVPTGLKAQVDGSNTIVVSWNSVESATSYDLEVDGKVFENVKSPFKHENLEAASKHTYKVRSVKATAKSDFSKEVVAITENNNGILDPVVFPATPRNFKVTQTGKGSVKLTWEAVKDAEFYEIEIDHQMYRTTKTEIVKDGLITGDKYPFRVRTRNHVGASEWTEHTYLTIQDTINPPEPPVDPPVSDGLPKNLLVGYWHNFDNGSTSTPLKDTSLNYDIIDVAFAESMPDQATMYFDPYNATPEEFKKEVEYLQSKGKKVIISIGGQNGRLHLDTKEKEDIFVETMIEIIERYGFDGMDIDLEGGAVSLGPGDVDINNPTTPKVVNLISATKRICSHFGKDFILTMAPEVTYVQGGLVAYAGPWGAYLPVIHNLRDELTLLHVQHYNHGSQEGMDGNTYAQGTADFQVAMAEMMITGFNVGRNPENFFPGLPASKVAIGLPSSRQAAGSGYITEAEVIKALDYLIKGKDFGGKYKLKNPQGYKDFRGVMTWSTNWDETVNFQFSNAYRNYFDALK
ncbi:MAG: glycosyl hydrolase family 18 protein [Sarcina sp.]